LIQAWEYLFLMEKNGAISRIAPALSILSELICGAGLKFPEFEKHGSLRRNCHISDIYSRLAADNKTECHCDDRPCGLSRSLFENRKPTAEKPFWPDFPRIFVTHSNHSDSNAQKIQLKRVFPRYGFYSRTGS
jgi:hypothetical protein